MIEKRKTIMDLFLEDVKNGNITKENKERLYNLVKNHKGRTDLQKNRFLMYYNLIPGQTENYNYVDLAKREGCTCSAVRYSISAFKIDLFNVYKFEEKAMLVKIVNDCRNGRY